MSEDERESGSFSHGASANGGNLDQGRRYWKAAIAHLAPEKREAAWEFYLDRLESSAAADTLGGVMLLLEAHLAFFDNLPARLGVTAQHLESASKSARSGGLTTPEMQPQVTPIEPGSDSSASARGLSDWVKATLWTSFGAILALAGAWCFLKPSEGDFARMLHHEFQSVRRTGVQTLSVEPWYDPALHRQRGCLVSFGRAAWTERTSTGGAKVYILSPIEDVRHDLELLRQMTSADAPTVPRLTTPSVKQHSE